MKFRYLNLKGGKRFLIQGIGRIASNSDAEPTKYPSYILPQEIYDNSVTVHPSNAFIGYVKNGVYSGLLGDYEDYNGNHYNFVFENGVFTARISGPHATQNEVSYSNDCNIFFRSSMSNDPDFKGDLGVAIQYPFTGGSYIDVSTPALGFALVTSEGEYNALMGEFGGRQIINIGYIDGTFGGKVSIKDTQDAKYFGFRYQGGTTIVGPSFNIGSGDGQIEIDDSVTEEDSDEDPYNDDDESGDGGGDGDHDDSSDDINIPDLPSLSAVDTGFVTLYNPSVAQLRNLASYMWSNAFDLDNFKKMLADPMDAIIGLSIVPLNVPSGSSQTVQVGNINTGITMTKANSQYVEVDCGSLQVSKYWGAYLDYDPFTKFELYLPYVGVRAISADDVMGKTVKIVYHVDILSGALVAFVKCGNSVLYSFEGQCACSVPIANIDWTESIKTAVDIAAKLGSAAGQAYVNPVGAASDAASAASSVESLKPSIEKSGSIGGMGGQLGIQKPYFIITRPRQAVPGNQNLYQGYPSFTTKSLMNLSGYTEIESIILDNVSASDDEKDEIMQLLKGGVIL